MDSSDLKFRSLSETFVSNQEFIDFANSEHRENTENTQRRYKKKLDKIPFERFENRIRQFLSLAKQNNIRTILLTHPSMVGTGIDSLTGCNLETIVLYDKSTGKEMQQKIERYNNITRKLAKEFDVPLIDLYDIMPRSSAYYFDHQHFTKEGCKLVADSVWVRLKNVL